MNFSSKQIFLPGSTIGIIGGGQLGRMSAMAAAKLGYRVHILNPMPSSPAIEVSSSVTVGSFDDENALKDFASHCDVVTFEFENISVDGLALLETLRPVRPSGNILKISQDRILEKRSLEKLGISVAPWKEINTFEDLTDSEHEIGFPFVLKTTRFGYDGKGQFQIERTEDWNGLKDLPYPLVAEKRINFQCELSVMVVRGLDGTVRCFDTVENRHKNSILDITLAPAPIMPDIAQKAQRIAIDIAENFGLIGILGVEFFYTSDGELLVNEIAPRPHNSGHWTMDACLIDQFEMHMRAVAGIALPTPRRHSDAIMHNLVGPDDMKKIPDLLKLDSTSVHLYGKNEARTGRKMGHVNTIFPYGSLPGELAISKFLNTKVS